MVTVLAQVPDTDAWIKKKLDLETEIEQDQVSTMEPGPVPWIARKTIKQERVNKNGNTDN